MASSNSNIVIDMSLLAEHFTYFVVKCNTIDDLETCIKTGRWACRKRLQPPHPRDLLCEAHRKGRVILIFSVTKNHGWHGFCESELQTSIFEDQPGMQVKKEEPTDNSEIENYLEWDYFPVRWCVQFQDISKQTCLASAATYDLKLMDGSSVNRARNWQQISKDSGKSLCELISTFKIGLLQQKQLLEQQQQNMIEPSFLKHEEQHIESMSQAQGCSVFDGWDSVINKVEKEYGKVHLVCPFGSQRYNCSVPGSDSDIFLVYQAKTTDVLGLDPPKQTIKNSKKSLVDYTILELHRYCELLVSGDPRCIETLYLSEGEGLMQASPQWLDLTGLRESLLTQICLEKYLREAQGTTGLKNLHKWHAYNDCLEEMTAKMKKLGYIVLRLLQSARDMTTRKTLNVYRRTGSVFQQELLSTRQGSLSFTQFMTLCNGYLDDIQASRGKLKENSMEIKKAVEKWLIDCRIKDLSL